MEIIYVYYIHESRPDLKKKKNQETLPSGRVQQRIDVEIVMVKEEFEEDCS